MEEHPLLGPEIDVRSRFPAERAALLSLLCSLEAAQWAAATVRLDADTAWRMCTRMIEPGEAAARGVLTGDRGPAAACCRIVSILR